MARVFLISSYESGHQPLSLAWPAAFLREAGHQVSSCDTSVQSLDDASMRRALDAAEFVGIATPMHTAMRLGVEVARKVRTLNPRAHICFYGLYGWLNSDYLFAEQSSGLPLADSVIAGEYEAPLLQLVEALAAGQKAESVPGVTTRARQSESHMARLTLPLPQRAQLPALEHYAHYMSDGRAVQAGYVESSRGCLHTCRHCPVTPVYKGRFFIVPLETVLADVRQQVQAGARHITFGDPDFLNGPGHALKVARAMHDEFPGLTFDFTTKVEHILERRDMMPQLREFGATFVVSAFEATSNAILQRLNKGHTVADMVEALQVARDAGVALQPTWMPFTPWTSVRDYQEMLQWIREQDLVENVPAVQLSIRMLVPPRSALLDHEDVDSWLGPLDAANFTYRWRHPDPCMDQLHADVARLVESQPGANAHALFDAVERLAYEVEGRQPPQHMALPALELRSMAQPPPRLTEDWFC